MTVTILQIRAYLDAEEPNYPAAAQLGADALSSLDEMVKTSNDLLASKAVYLASLIPSALATGVLKRGSVAQSAVVRVAAAAAIRNHAASASLLPRLLNDADLGVRKQALISVGRLKPAGVKISVQKLASNDPSPFIRNLAASVLQQLP